MTKTGHGGARAGAGRPRKPQSPPLDVPVTDQPLQFLLSVMHAADAAPALRVKAATEAAKYIHVRASDTGKKAAAADKATKAATGKFKAAAVPLQLVIK